MDTKAILGIQDAGRRHKKNHTHTPLYEHKHKHPNGRDESKIVSIRKSKYVLVTEFV